MEKSPNKTSSDVARSPERGGVSDVPEIKVHAKTLIVVAACCYIYFAQLIAIVGSGMLAQSITGYLKQGDTSGYIWFSTVIGIFTLALCPPICQAADYWGRKWFLVATTAIGGAGCFIVARASSYNMCVAGFCVVGVAFGSQALTFAVISEVLPRKYRALGQAASTTSAGLGAVVAALMGGALLRSGGAAGFRTYYYVAGAIMFLSSALITLAYRSPSRELEEILSTGQKLKSLDWVGYVCITAGLVLFTVALSYSDNPYPWKDPHVAAVFAVGCALLVGFGLYEWLGRIDGLLHHDLFSHRNFAISLMAIFLEGLAFFTTNSYFAFEASVVNDLNSFQGGARVAVLFASSFALSPIAGLITTKTKRVREVAVFGFLMFLCFSAAMTSVTPKTSPNFTYGIAIICGCGLGFVLPTLTVAAQLATPPEMIAVTSGLFTAVRSLGGAIALAINNAVFTSSLTKALPAKIAAAVIPLGFNPMNLGQLIPALAANDIPAVLKVPGVTPAIGLAGGEAVVESYVVSFQKAWYVATAFCALGVVMCVFLKNPKSEFTSFVDAPVEEEIVQVQRETKLHSDHVEYVH